MRFIMCSLSAWWWHISKVITASPGFGIQLSGLLCDTENPDICRCCNKIQLSNSQIKRKILADTCFLLKLEICVFKKCSSKNSVLVICSMLGQTSVLLVR